MKLWEFKQLIAEHASSLIPEEYRDLIYIPSTGRAETLYVGNTNTQDSRKILSSIKQKNVSFQLARNENLSGAKILESYSFDTKENEVDIEKLLKSEDATGALEEEKAKVEHNMDLALTHPSSRVYQFLQIARKEGIFDEQSTETEEKEIPNPLHDLALTSLLAYGEKNRDFSFWLRERNTKNRLNEGFWFQGKEDYAFAGLYNASAGNLSTKSVGLVFWQDGNNRIQTTLEIIFKNEDNPELLRFYEFIKEALLEDFGSDFEIFKEHHFRLYLKSFEPFLDKYLPIFDGIIDDLGLINIKINESEFTKKLDRTSRIRQEIFAGNFKAEKEETGPSEDDVIEDDAKPDFGRKQNSNVNLQTDIPSNVDELGRQPFVNALFEYIKRLWSLGESRSYTIHINGEWGSGKSTVLKLLEEKLESYYPEKNDKSQQWVVVNFNAWQNQHMLVPWWVFLDTVYRSIRKEAAFFKGAWIYIKEQYWRLVSMNKAKWVTFVFLMVIVISTVLYGSSFLELNKLFEAQTKDKLTIIVSMISLFGTVWVFFGSIFNSLLPGSEEAAMNYKQQVRDPMKKIKDHYAEITNYSPKNVAVFIDDIDRCNTQFVVQLLEGLQTLFRTNKVLYVIAGDAAWIRKSFEIHYKDLRDIIDKPGQSLGNFFVEKTLQQSINLPPITDEIKKAYWNKLLGGKEIATDQNSFKESEQRLDAAVDDATINLIIDEAATPEEKVFLQSKAAEKTSSEEILKEIEHELLKYSDHLDPNPRGMKRLVNNIALEKAANYVGGISGLINQDVLIRWAIFKSRFPLLANDLLKGDIEIKNEGLRATILNLLEDVDLNLLRKYKS